LSCVKAVKDVVRSNLSLERIGEQLAVVECMVGFETKMVIQPTAQSARLTLS
jgi:hypothetical protein